jgi:DNA helicase-2/ATP-dependent DNA helicase PcrA
VVQPLSKRLAKEQAAKVWAQAVVKTQSAKSFSLAGLNPPQRRAVCHTEGPLLVLAGAGSGKTRVIIHRIARLIDDGVPPQAILGVTFTNKAAQQMRQRLQALVGRAARAVTLSTFHALGLQIIQEEYAAAGLRQGFCIYDMSDQVSLVRDLLRRVKVADRRLDAARILDLILRTKRARLDEVQLLWGDDHEMAAFDLFPRYVKQMHLYNAIDFDDLILRSQDALQDPAVMARWRQRFSYLLVDEYQDTSADQLALLQALCGSAQNICAVGDDDQAIYGWRGAAQDNIAAFTRHFAGAQEIILEQNYRSTGNILAAANALIAANKARKPKVLFTGDGLGEPVRVVECVDDQDEALFVAETVRRLQYEGVSYADMAVLYRSNVQSRAFEEALAQERVPYKVVGGQAYYDRKEVRDAMAFLAVACNPTDEVALRRIINVPPRGIGDTSVERLVQHAEQHKLTLWQALRAAASIDALPKSAVQGAAALIDKLLPAAQALRQAKAGEAAPVVRKLLCDLCLKDAVLAADDTAKVCARRLDNLAEVPAALERFEARAAKPEKILEQFMRNSALVREQEKEAGPDCVTLMTLHSAKGLEFHYVLLVGLEEDLLPHRRAVEAQDSDSPADLSEERRLCYVGATRARTQLFITHAGHRVQRGKAVPRTPSRFLSDLPEGPGVRRLSRVDGSPQASDAAHSDHLAQEFFRKMRTQLGIA